MSNLAQVIRPAGAHLAVTIVLSLLYLGGAMEFIENRLFDLRFALTKKPAGNDIVLVTIDTGSLKDIGVWPWPRGIYAEALDNIVQANPRVIAYNLDFSSASLPAADLRLAESVAAAGRKVILPAFVQTAQQGDSGGSLSYTSPLPALARHSTVASVNFFPDTDGLVRESHTEVAWRDGRLPSFSALLSGQDDDLPSRFFVDYAIDSSSFTRVSFADVLHSRTDLGLLTDKIVIVGATAAELADTFPTPQGAAVPGSVLHALAAESILQHRTLSRMSPFLGVGGIFLAIFAFAPFCSRRPWQQSLAVAAGIVLAIHFLALGIQYRFPLLIDVAPWTISMLAAFGLGVTRLINSQNLDLLAQKLAIKRKEALVQGIVETAFDAVITVDERGLIWSANRRAAEMFDLDTIKLVGRGLGDFLRWDSHLDTGNFLETAAGREDPMEITALRNNGSKFVANMAINKIPADNGQARFIVLLLDVTALRQAQAEARDIGQRLTSSLEAISEGIALWGENGRLLTCNARFQEFHAAAAHMLAPGCLFSDFIRDSVMLGPPPDALGREREWIAERIDRHNKPGGRFLQQTSDGRWLRTIEQRTGSGEIICVETDITDEQINNATIVAARDDAESISQAKTRFLANASHEMRRPLTAILKVSRTMLDEGENPLNAGQSAEHAIEIYRRGARLLTMVDDILELSRIDSGLAQLDESRVDPQLLIRECAVIAGNDMEGFEGPRLKIEIQDGLPDIHVDQSKIRQCLLRLMSHAIDCSQTGTTIDVTANTDHSGAVRISVSGVASSVLPGDTAQSGGFDRSSLGIGLALADAGIRQHGGRLEIVNTGVSTAITLHIPAERTLRHAAGKDGAFLE
jgi:PAS domain S-box-containing protein